MGLVTIRVTLTREAILGCYKATRDKKSMNFQVAT